MILKSKATIDKQVSVGDMIEIYSQTGMNKRGTWSTPKIILSIDHDARSVTIPAKGGKMAIFALEDIILALPVDSLTQHVQDVLDAIDEVINEYTNIDGNINDNMNSSEQNDTFQELVESNDAEFSRLGHKNM